MRLNLMNIRICGSSILTRNSAIENLRGYPDGPCHNSMEPDRNPLLSCSHCIMQDLNFKIRSRVGTLKNSELCSIIINGYRWAWI